MKRESGRKRDNKKKRKYPESRSREKKIKAAILVCFDLLLLVIFFNFLVQFLSFLLVSKYYHVSSFCHQNPQLSLDYDIVFYFPCFCVLNEVLCFSWIHKRILQEKREKLETCNTKFTCFFFSQTLTYQKLHEIWFKQTNLFTGFTCLDFGLSSIHMDALFTVISLKIWTSW